MKSTHLFLLLAFFLMISAVESLSAQEKKKNEKVVFYVENMNCKNCQATIEKYIPFEKGVKDLKCDLENKKVTVTYDLKKTNTEKLKEGFKKIKFPAVIAPSTSELSEKKKE